MTGRVYSVPGQTEGKMKAFMEWTITHLSSKLSLTCGGNVNYQKNVHHNGGNRKHPDNFQSKSVSSPFNLVSRYVFFFAKVKGRERPFMEGARREGGTLQDYPQRALGCHTR